MSFWEKLETAQQMQEYLLAHQREEPFPFSGFYAQTGYSRRHADRIFHAFFSKTPQEYLRALRLSSSSLALLEEERDVLDVALEHGFQSHEGYTRSFARLFGVTPSQYRRGKDPIPVFIPYPVRSYYAHTLKKEDCIPMEKSAICMVTPVSRPQRKLLLLRSRKATDYWSYCEEMCCEWEGLFNSIPSKLDTAAILTLPTFLQKPGYSSIASGVELPLEYDGRIPEGCELAELAACELFYFRTPPFPDAEGYAQALSVAFQALESCDPAAFGYRFADELAPRMNFGADTKTGARLAVPVKRL